MCLSMTASATDNGSSNAFATLNEDTTWNVRFFFSPGGSLRTESGQVVRQEQIFTAQIKFVEEVGYEPPQGDLTQVSKVNLNDDDNDDDKAERTTSAFQITKSRWQLSEDPEERKDGLWVWGLFQEPLYPFLLLQMEIERIPLPGTVATSTKENDNDNDGDAGPDYIPPLKLFVKLNHQRDRETGAVTLSANNDLTIRQVETMAADPFGAATVDLYEELAVGKLQITPVV